MAVNFFVKTPLRETLTISFTEEEFKSATVLQLKTKLREIGGTRESDQQLLFNGRELEDQRLLSDCGVKHEDTIDMDLLPGGQWTMGGMSMVRQMREMAGQMREMADYGLAVGKAMGDGGMGDREGRNKSMDRLANFLK